jgi:hypothetical protein
MLTEYPMPPNTTPNEGHSFGFIASTVAQRLDPDLFSPEKKVRPKVAVENLCDEGVDPFAIAVKATTLIELVAFNWLDQEGRTRRKPLSPGALRVISSERARRARLVSAAALIDLHTSAGIPDKVGTTLLNVLLLHQGFGPLVNGKSGRALLHDFKEMDRRLKYVLGITDYLVRAAVYPDHRNPETLADAKVYVCKWEDDCGLSKIEKIWEDFKLAAPYIYAFHQERSFRPIEAKCPRDALNWALAFVGSPARVARLLGRAAFAMDVMKRYASDQRVSDFKGIARVVPSVRPFNSEERAIIESIDRTAPLK